MSLDKEFVLSIYPGIRIHMDTFNNSYRYIICFDNQSWEADTRSKLWKKVSESIKCQMLKKFES